MRIKRYGQYFLHNIAYRRKTLRIPGSANIVYSETAGKLLEVRFTERGKIVLLILLKPGQVAEICTGEAINYSDKLLNGKEADLVKPRAWVGFTLFSVDRKSITTHRFRINGRCFLPVNYWPKKN